MDVNQVQLIIQIGKVKDALKPEISFAKLQLDEPELAEKLILNGYHDWLLSEVFNIDNETNKKQKIGNELFAKIDVIDATLSPKITGMLIDGLNSYKLFELLCNENKLMYEING
eukprot:397424_1